MEILPRLPQAIFHQPNRRRRTFGGPLSRFPALAGGDFPTPRRPALLILDVLLGDPPLFPRHEEVELSWKILDPIEEFWETQGQPEQYAPGTWGPASADALMARDGRVWRRP